MKTITYDGCEGDAVERAGGCATPELTATSSGHD